MDKTHNPFNLSVDLRMCLINYRSDSHSISHQIIEIIYDQVGLEIMKRSLEGERLPFAVLSMLSMIYNAVKGSTITNDPGDTSDIMTSNLCKVNYNY